MIDTPALLAELDKAIAGAEPQARPALVVALVALAARAATLAAVDMSKMPANAPEGALLTMSEVAELLSVPEEMARELGRRGDLATVQVGDRYVRVRPAAVAAYIATRERIDNRLSTVLRSPHEGKRRRANPNGARPHAGGVRIASARPRDDGEPMGTGGRPRD